MATKIARKTNIGASKSVESLMIRVEFSNSPTITLTAKQDFELSAATIDTRTGKKIDDAPVKVLAGTVLVLVESSIAGYYYIGRVDASGHVGCSCPSHQNRRACTHQPMIEAASSHRAVSAPVKERKPRTYSFDVPTDTLAMRALVATLHKTTSTSKAQAICKVFAGMADQAGMITVHHMQWYFDRDLQNIFERVQVEVPATAPTMTEECPVDVPQLSCEEQTEAMHAAAPWDAKSGVLDPDPFATEDELPELPEVVEEVALNVEPLTDEEAALFEQIGNDEIVLVDEIKVEEEWTVPVVEEEKPELTKAQAIMCVRQCAIDLVDACDGAEAKDEAGCTGYDVKFMHRMVGKELWKAEEVVKVTERLQKYKNTQLKGRIPQVAIVQKALGLAPKAPSATPQAPKFTSVDYNSLTA